MIHEAVGGRVATTELGDVQADALARQVVLTVSEQRATGTR